MRKSVAFLHYCTYGDIYQDIGDELFNNCIESGMLDDPNFEWLNVCVCGTGPVKIPNHPKIRIYAKIDRMLPERESFTIAQLQDFSQKNPNYNVLFFHLKGCSNGQENPCIADWRKFMAYATINCYKECWAALEDHQTCGVDLRDFPKIHYSGMFWYGRSEYLATLPRIEDVMGDNWRIYQNPQCYLSPRHGMEFWICFGTGSHYCLWDCGIGSFERHLHEYKPENYVGKIKYVK